MHACAIRASDLRKRECREESMCTSLRGYLRFHRMCCSPWLLMMILITVTESLIYCHDIRGIARLNEWTNKWKINKQVTGFSHVAQRKRGSEENAARPPRMTREAVNAHVLPASELRWAASDPILKQRACKITHTFIINCFETIGFQVEVMTSRTATLLSWPDLPEMRPCFRTYLISIERKQQLCLLVLYLIRWISVSVDTVTMTQRPPAI